MLSSPLCTLMITIVYLSLLPTSQASRDGKAAWSSSQDGGSSSGTWSKWTKPKPPHWGKPPSTTTTKPPTTTTTTTKPPTWNKPKPSKWDKSSSSWNKHTSSSWDKHKPAKWDKTTKPPSTKPPTDPPSTWNKPKPSKWDKSSSSWNKHKPAKWDKPTKPPSTKPPTNPPTTWNKPKPSKWDKSSSSWKKHKSSSWDKHKPAKWDKTTKPPSMPPVNPPSWVKPPSYPPSTPPVHPPSWVKPPSNPPSWDKPKPSKWDKSSSSWKKHKSSSWDKPKPPSWDKSSSSGKWSKPKPPKCKHSIGQMIQGTFRGDDGEGGEFARLYVCKAAKGRYHASLYRTTDNLDNYIISHNAFSKADIDEKQRMITEHACWFQERGVAQEGTPCTIDASNLCETGVITLTYTTSGETASFDYTKISSKHELIGNEQIAPYQCGVPYMDKKNDYKKKGWSKHGDGGDDDKYPLAVISGPLPYLGGEQREVQVYESDDSGCWAYVDNFEGYGRFFERRLYLSGSLWTEQWDDKALSDDQPCSLGSELNIRVDKNVYLIGWQCADGDTGFGALMHKTSDYDSCPISL